MPQSARFKTERSQKLAVGAMTLLVAAAALGAAHLYTQAHQASWEVELIEAKIGQLQILVPDGWKQIDVTGQESGFAEGPRIFIDEVGGVRRRLLSIGRLDVPTPTPPDIVLRAFLHDRVMRNARPYVDDDVSRRQRVGPFVVVQYNAQSRIDKDTATTTERVVVFTEDGRRHWAITLSMAVTSDESAERASDAMLSKMIQSIDDGHRRDAIANDFVLAMLPSVSSQGWRARVERGFRGVQAVTLTPGDSSPGHLAMIRVQGELNTEDSTIEQVRPAEALAEQFEQALSQSPDPQALKPVERGKARIWRLPFSDQPGSILKRELIYAALDPEHGVLIDALAEDAAWPAVSEQIDRLIDTLGDSVPVAEIGQATPGNLLLDASIQRGEHLAQVQRRTMLDTRAQGRQYWLMRREHRTHGAQIVQIRHLKSENLPVVHQIVEYMAGDQYLRKSTITARYASDGQTMHCELVYMIQRGGTPAMYAFHIAMQGQTLTMWPFPMVGVIFEGWSMPVPAGYFPALAEELWDMDEVYNLASAGPCVVWRGSGESKPQPYWLMATRRPANAEISDPTLPNAAAVLTLRSIMAPDASRIWLDADGRVIHGEWHETGGFPYGGVRLTFTASDAQTVRRLFPDSRDTIDQLDKAANQP